MTTIKRAMRDVFVEALTDRMKHDNRLFFLSADFGSPALDRMRVLYEDRFINVGIAEQNLINVATGLALEGYIVYAYAIAPFITMRCFEQVRTNLSIMSQLKSLNVNLIGVGAGCSYDVSGPSHHCLEDMIIMRMLPQIDVFSPSDPVLAEKLVNYSIEHSNPKYFRFDAKPMNVLYDSTTIDLRKGLFPIREGGRTCIVATGYMTHKAIEVADLLRTEGITVSIVDFFALNTYDQTELREIIGRYKTVITLEEGFIRRGGLDSLLADFILDNRIDVELIRLGMDDTYTFDLGNRENIHEVNGLGSAQLVKLIKNINFSYTE